MFKNFHNTFQKLPSSTKSMVFIMWLYFFGQVVANVFIGIYIYTISQSFFDIAVYNILLFMGAFISFVGLGLLAGIYKWNIKNFYFGGYFLFILAFLVLLLNGGAKIGVYSFGVIYGAGIGLYYNAVHTQELKNISKHSRGHYSSSVTLGKNLIESLLPLVLAGLFYLGNVYNFEMYPILFISLICIYIIGLFKIKGIEDYYPNKINKNDIINFCNFKKYKYGHLYFLNNGITHILFTIILSIVAIYFLKNEVNIGIFQGILAIIGTILIIYTSFKRDDNNLFFYFSLFSILIFINFVIFSLNFTFIGYMIFLLVSLIIAPLYRVSEHVYDLTTMDNVKTDSSDFYPAMVMREVILWIGRLIAFIFVLIMFYYLDNDTELLIRLFLILVGFSCITQIFLIRLWEKNEKIDNI